MLADRSGPKYEKDRLDAQLRIDRTSNMAQIWVMSPP